MSRKLLSCKEVAGYLGVAEKTLRLWVAQRRFPSVRIGRTVRIPSDAIETLIETNTTPAAGER